MSFHKRDLEHFEILKSTSEHVLELLSQTIGVNTIFLSINNNGVNTIVKVVNKDATHIIDGMNVPLEDIVGLKVKEIRSEPFIINDLSKLQRHSDDKTDDFFKVGCLLGVPIILERGTEFGTLCAFDNQPRQFTENEISVVKTMGQLLSHTIDLENMSIRDSLTGLYNRLYLKNYIQDLNGNSKAPLAVFTINLDNFRIKSRTGKYVEDEADVLQMSECLQSYFSNDKIIARLNGNKFVIIIPNYASEQRGNIEQLADAFLTEVTKSLVIDEHPVNVTANIGISFYPENGIDLDELLMNANYSTWSILKSGKNQISFKKDMLEQVISKMKKELLNALTNNQLSLHYQPIFHLPTNSLISFEALLRWNHPELGSVSPVDFIPVAEETGLIVEIGDWVIQQVCKEGSLWEQHGLPIPIFSVNLSVVQFEDENFTNRIHEIVEMSGFDYNKLAFEITESMIMKDVHFIKKKLVKLEKMGIKFSIDDFGTGYSSLAYLSELPIRYLKLDKTFTMNLFKDQKNILIAKSIINLAHTMGINCIAEGIETEEQLQFLQEHETSFGQGYLLGKPMSVSAALKFHENFVSQSKVNLIS